MMGVAPPRRPTAPPASPKLIGIFPTAHSGLPSPLVCTAVETVALDYQTVFGKLLVGQIEADHMGACGSEHWSLPAARGSKTELFSRPHSSYATTRWRSRSCQ
jgi:hypothetical protein